MAPPGSRIVQRERGRANSGVRESALALRRERRQGRRALVGAAHVVVGRALAEPEAVALDETEVVVLGAAAHRALARARAADPGVQVPANPVFTHLGDRSSRVSPYRERPCRGDVNPRIPASSSRFALRGPYPERDARRGRAVVIPIARSRESIAP